VCSLAVVATSIVCSGWTIDATRQFYDVAEMESFLRSDDTDQQAYVPDTHDCEDFAFDLVEAARLKGYTVFIQVELDDAHVLNSTIIGNDIYFIEPQTDEYWFVGHLDYED